MLCCTEFLQANREPGHEQFLKCGEGTIQLENLTGSCSVCSLSSTQGTEQAGESVLLSLCNAEKVQSILDIICIGITSSPGIKNGNWGKHIFLSLPSLCSSLRQCCTLGVPSPLRLVRETNSAREFDVRAVGEAGSWLGRVWGYQFFLQPVK